MPTRDNVPERSLEEPRTERNQEGDEIAFTEALDTNIKVIKASLKGCKGLKIKYYYVGEMAKTKVAVIWNDLLVDKCVLKEVMEKIEGIKVRYVSHSKIICDELQEFDTAPFNNFKMTERFMSAVSMIMEGRVCIVVDRTPMAITVPHLFFENFTAEGDYTDSFGRFSYRLFRLIQFFVSIYLPALFLIGAVWHLNDVPVHYRLWFKGTEDTMPIILQILILGMLLRMLTDAAFRINKNLLFIYSILSGAIVTALIAGKPFVFNIYLVQSVLLTDLFKLSLARRMGGAISTLRFVFTIVAWLWDWEGLAIATGILLLKMFTAKSFGVGFMSPIIPFRPAEWGDSIFGRFRNLKAGINRRHIFRKEQQ